MNVVTVTPISRGLFKESLTYFSTLPIAPGAIVTVPVRNRLVEALVLEVKPVEDAKSSLKSANFALKKIERVKHESFFNPNFLEAARQTSKYFISPLGQTLSNLVPADILTTAGKLTNSPVRREAKVYERPRGLEKYILQEADDDRLVYYKGLVREEFARGFSVFLCLPTLAEIKKVVGFLGRGIDNYTIILHGRLGKKSLLEAWQQAVTIKHPVLIIGTPIFLSLPRPDLKTIIIDRENSPGYRTLNRPFFDYRIFAERLAEVNRQQFILGDLVLRTETVHLLEKGAFQPKVPLKHHLISVADQVIMSAKNPPGEFRIFGEELLELIKRAAAASERLFLFVHRRGLAPIVVCEDCGTAVTCRNCHGPVSWHKRGDGDDSFFLCHHCGDERGPAEKCANCGGWRLLGLGIGLERVARELGEALPHLKISRLDSDEVKNERQASLVIKKFLDTPGGVLVGTEMATHYLKDKVENIAVVAIDSLFAIPDYRINERVFNLLIRLRSLANKRFIIQTRSVRSELFDYASRGALLDFYRHELKERRDYGYPPFKIFIKINLTGDKNDVLLAIKALEKDLAGYEFDTFAASRLNKGTDFGLNLLLRLKTDAWPDEKLFEILESLPPQYVVTVDPENLLD